MRASDGDERTATAAFVAILAKAALKPVAASAGPFADVVVDGLARRIAGLPEETRS